VHGRRTPHKPSLHNCQAPRNKCLNEYCVYFIPRTQQRCCNWRNSNCEFSNRRHNTISAPFFVTLYFGSVNFYKIVYFSFQIVLRIQRYSLCRPLRRLLLAARHEPNADNVPATSLPPAVGTVSRNGNGHPENAVGISPTSARTRLLGVNVIKLAFFVTEKEGK
jgi:hypothetical protein